MTIPNFLVIGAARSGTTSLYYYLKQHPQIYMSPVKEPRFFAFQGERLDSFYEPPGAGLVKESITDFAAYCALFEGVSRQTAIGEASQLYFWSAKACENIRRTIPLVKLIVILRDPAERAYSHFLLNRQNNCEPAADFAHAVREELSHVRDDWFAAWRYITRGFYHVQLKRYYDLFDKEQIKVYLYEDFCGKPTWLLRDLFQFLHVDDRFVPEMSERHWQSQTVRSKALDSALTTDNPFKRMLKPWISPVLKGRASKMIKNLNTYKPKLSRKIRRDLIKIYRKDILTLQDLIQRDLSKWLIV